MEKSRMDNPFVQATRTAQPLCLGLVGEGGCGKTYSSLLVARGLVGPAGNIALIDTEHEKSRLFADVTAFDVMPMQAPFTVERFLDAINAAVEHGYHCLIIDSASDEWTGEGGLLEQKDDRVQGLQAWKPIKAMHQDFKHALQAHPLHVICTLRGKEIHKQVKDAAGKSTIVKEGLGPDSERTTEYIFDVLWYLDHSHRATIRKDRTRLFNQQPEMLREEHGARLRQWLAQAEPLANRGKPGGVYENEMIQGSEKAMRGGRPEGRRSGSL